MVQSTIKFLLDENVPIKLKQTITNIGFNCNTIQEKGWSGYKDKDISMEIQNLDVIFITRDKDFKFLWKKYNLNVVYLAIEPAIFDFINPRVKDLVSNWDYHMSQPFLIILQKNSIRIWQKTP